MDLFLIGDACGGLKPLVSVIFSVLKIFWIIIPIGLIVFGTIDLGKAVIASDDKEVKAAQKRLISRFIYAALIFFVPVIVSAIMNLVAENVSTVDSGDASWSSCWCDVTGLDCGSKK